MKRKCLILKDAQGGLCGYLMQEDERIVLCRRSGVQAEGTLVCIDAHGGALRRPMVEGAEEMQWADDGEPLEMACGVRDGELLFASGEDAKRAYLLGRADAQAGAQDLCAAKREDGAQIEPLRDETTAAENRAQEARWPPPPCLAGARYCGGVWRIGGES